VPLRQTVPGPHPAQPPEPLEPPELLAPLPAVEPAPEPEVVFPAVVDWEHPNASRQRHVTHA